MPPWDDLRLFLACYRGRSAIREAGKVAGLPDDLLDRMSGLMTHSSLRDVQAQRLRERGNPIAARRVSIDADALAASLADVEDLEKHQDEVPRQASAAARKKADVALATLRNFAEIFRVIDALQLAARHPIATPVNWQPGGDVMIQPTVSDEKAAELFPGFSRTAVPSGKGYIRFTSAPK
jgi:hypothetical protein